MNYKNNKIVIIGDTGVGKSTMMGWVTNNRYLDRLEPTIGASFCIKKFDVGYNTIGLNIWDTAGQERYRSIVGLYYKDTVGCLCVFDVTNHESFRNLDYWLSEYQNSLPDKNHIIILVANKCDNHRDKWCVDNFDIEEYAAKNGFELIYTDCISGKNVILAFEKLAESIYDMKIKNRILEFEENDASNESSIIDLKLDGFPFHEDKCSC